MAYYLGVEPMLGALLFAVLSSVGIEWSSSHGKIRSDSAVGIVWSVGMAIGAIFIFLTPGYAPNLMSFLFGSILAVTTSDIVALGCLSILLLALFPLFWRQVVWVAFDRQFALTRGVRVDAINYSMAVIIALGIVFSIRMVGIVMLISLLTMPAVIVNSLTKSYLKITLWSILIAVVANVAGLWLSYAMNIPASAATIFLLAFTLIAVKLLPLRSLFPKTTSK